MSQIKEPTIPVKIGMKEALDLLKLGRHSNIDNLVRLLNEEVARVEFEELQSAEALIRHLGVEIGEKVIVKNNESQSTIYYLAGFTMDERVTDRLGKKKSIRYDLRKVRKDGSMGLMPMVRHSVLNPVDLSSIAPFKGDK